MSNKRLKRVGNSWIEKDKDGRRERKRGRERKERGEKIFAFKAH